MGRPPKTGRFMVTAAKPGEQDIERPYATAGAALSFAQNVACRWLEDEGSVFVRSCDDNDEMVYRVDRDKNGCVYTYAGFAKAAA